MSDSSAPTAKRNWGCTVFGWLLFVAAAGFLVLVGLKTGDYYAKIKRGDIVALPQFRDQFTASKTAVLSRDAVQRSAVETDSAPATGAEAKDAKLVIVEFADFECPYSKQESSVVRSLLAKYGSTVRLEYRNYPLTDIHLNAEEAANAAACADEQGKFWAYHDRLYQHSPSLGHADLLQYASEAGLDETQFDKCLAAERYKGKVDQDASDALGLGVSGTPVFFFNGQKVEGAIPQATFEQLIQRMAK